MVQQSRQVRVDGTDADRGSREPAIETYSITVETRKWLTKAQPVHHMAILDKAAGVLLHIQDEQDPDIQLELRRAARVLQECSRAIETDLERRSRPG